MLKQKTSAIFFLILFFSLPIGLANALNRDQIMQKELDCINQYKKSSHDLHWNDVCYTYPMSDENMTSSSEDKRQEVNTALDAYDPDQGNVELASDESQEIEESEVTKEKKPKTLSQEVKKFINHKEHQVEMGTEISHITYQEPIFELKDRGVMYGIYGVYTYRPKKDDLFSNSIINMYRLDAKWSYGQVDYTSTSGTIEGIDDNMFELRAVLGYDHYFAPDFMITPYWGIGYRRLSDDSSGKMTASGAHGYARVANYIYMPIGLELTHQLDPQWRVGGTGELDVFLWGRQDSNLSDVDPQDYPDIKNRQRRGMGLRASLKATRLGEKYNFTLEPFVRYWHIKNSDITEAINPAGTALISGLEPDNKSTEIGAKVGMQF